VDWCRQFYPSRSRMRCRRGELLDLAFSRFPRVRIPRVSVPKRNPETSYCEVRKSGRDSSGVLGPIEVVAVVKGVARAAFTPRYEN
jgi:hypothetical protein